MQNDEILLPLDIYYQHLTKIKDVVFTPREIDIIACLLNNRTATISSFLGIAPRAVESHTRNIRQKAHLPGRDNIIDFIEKSDKFSLIKNEYYNNLRIRVKFEEKLLLVLKNINLKSSSCLLIHASGEAYKPSLIPYLKEHLKRVGFEVKAHLNKDAPCFSLPKDTLNFSQFTHVLYIFPENFDHVDLAQINQQKMTSEEDQSIKNVHYINLFANNNYYLSFFELLEQLFPRNNLQSIVEEFKQQCEQVWNPVNEAFENKNSKEEFEESKKDAEEDKKTPTKFKEISSIFSLATISKKNKWLYLGITVTFISLLSISGIIFYREDLNQSRSSIRSDLTLPGEGILLNRAELISQIDNKFNKKKDIQTLALVGLGGAGKTTLARQYAREQKGNILWEINAETHSSLTQSFEKLAQLLSKTAEDQKLLREIQEIKNSTEREERVISFVKDRLRLQENWFLIYDNVENFRNIQKYFPKDSSTWGRGKIILTTRNTNIQNNSQINNVLLMGELSPDQKLSLFMNIMNHGGNGKSTASQKEEATIFLKQIPPFPLDVSVAAYYLKSTNIPYKQYIEKLKNYTKETNELHENILKETGEYTKTRYAIITHSLEHLINTNKDFGDLFLFISFLDSQNIPKSLLDQYKGSNIVDNFIYHLKAHSLLTIQEVSSFSEPMYAIHRSTQEISLAYLVEQFKLNKDSPILQKISYVLDDHADKAIEQEDFPRMRLIASHLEKFLTHHNVLVDFSKGLLESKLGSIYYFINDEKSKKMLEDSLNILQKKVLEPLSSIDISKLVRSLLHIGAIYTELRLDEKAQEAFENAVYIYRREEPKNYADLSWALSHLGNIHRKLSNYDKAKDFLEESVRLHKQYGTSNKRIARTLAYLGGVYRGLVGFHPKAIESLEESLAIYGKNFPNDDFRLGWVLTHLGNLYRDLGDYEKAKQHLEHSLRIFKKHLPENHISIGLTLGYLGNCFRELGEYEKSRDYLEQSLKIHQKHFDENHLRMGWIFLHLASTYKTLRNDEEAHQLFDKVLKIYAKHSGEENIKTTHFLRDMSESLLRDMAEISIEKNRLDDAESFIKRSLKILQHRNYVDEYRSLEVLGDIYLKKSLQPAYANNTQEVRNLKIKAIDAFKQALKIVEQCFPKGSVHIESIKNKVNNVKNEKI